MQHKTPTRDSEILRSVMQGIDSKESKKGNTPTSKTVPVETSKTEFTETPKLHRETDTELWKAQVRKDALKSAGTSKRFPKKR